MQEKTITPLKDEVTADSDASKRMIKPFIRSIPAVQKRLFTTALRMIICIPSGITSVDMRAVKENCKCLNRTKIYLIHKQMAEAVEIGVAIYIAFKNKNQ